MNRIAFITSILQPQITTDDQLLADYLSSQDIRVEAVPWDSPDVDWGAYNSIIFRSCWNYHHKPVEFNVWLDRMEALKLPFFNSLQTIRWNLHKQYLFEMQVKGIAIPPAVLVRQSESLLLKELMHDNMWDKVVVKPAVSAGARDTWVASIDSLNGAQQTFDESVRKADMIVQKFTNEITQHGEVSLIYINKQFSHAVVKRPKANDFRVQTELGGTVHAFTPSAELIRQGEQIVNSVSEPLLYARVDGVIVEEKLLLMELEVFEPALFFRFAPNSSYELFAGSLLK